MNQSSNSMVQKSSDSSHQSITRFDEQLNKKTSDEYKWLEEGYKKSFEKMNSTSTSLDETIANLKLMLIDMNKRLNIVTEESTYIVALKNEIANIKSSLSVLEAQKNSHSESLLAFQKFYQENIQFMFIATETNVKIKILEQKLAQTEEKADKAKDRSIAIWAIVISVITSLLACIGSILIAILGRGAY